MRRIFPIAISASLALSQQSCVTGMAASEPGSIPRFQDLCTSPHLSPGARHTVDTLLDAVGTRRCDKAAFVLESRTELLLGGKNIRDLSPLAHLSGLRSLYLDDNLIENVTPLRRLYGLRLLAMDRNPLGGRVRKDEANCPTDDEVAAAVHRFCKS